MFSKITGRISKPLSVFDKIGLGSKYRVGGGGGGTAFQHTEWKKNATSQGTRKPRINILHPQLGGKKEGTVN